MINSKFNKFQWASLYIATAAAAGSTLCLQLVQTRVLSALYYNHLVYITVTVALLGFGISGVLVAILSSRIKSLVNLAAAGLAGFAISVPVCVGISSYLPVLTDERFILFKLFLSYLLLTIPFIFSGITLASIFMVGGKIIHRLYFVDLVSSALGTVFFVLALTPLGAEGLLWCSSLTTILAFLVICQAFRLLGKFVIPPAIVLVLFILLHGVLINEIPDYGKMGSNILDNEDMEVLQSRWTTIAKIDVLNSKNFNWRFDPQLPPMQALRIGQDREAYTIIASKGVVDARLRLAHSNPPKIVCEAINFIAQPNPQDALVIGVGGGNDIINAIALGAKHIVGIEINEQTIDLMKTTYADYAVWPKLPNIELHCMDGRNYVASSNKKFDSINLSGIDTFSALSTGAYVLSENYLYTVEAINDYLSALKPNGILNIFRWNFQIPRESLRLCNLYLEAAKLRHIKNPEQCIMIVGTNIGWQYRWASMLMKNEPFTKEEVLRMLDQIRAQKPLALIYLPKIFSTNEQKTLEEEFFKYDHEYYKPNREAFAKLIDAKTIEDKRTFEKQYPYIITPVYDDRPFFFEYHRLTEVLNQVEPNSFGIRGVFVHYTLYLLFALTALISYLGMILPLHFYAKDGLNVGSTKPMITFFAALGLGYMFVELGVIQLLNIYLGHPMYSLGLVLAGLLLFTGVGSYLSGNYKGTLFSLVKIGLLGSATSILIWTLFMPHVIAATMGLSLWLRALISIVSILPLSLFMGVPFATGTRYLSSGKDRFIPWAWGINGLTSVAASILAILIAMRVGFTAILLLASVSYLVGFIAVKSFMNVKAAQ